MRRPIFARGRPSSVAPHSTKHIRWLASMTVVESISDCRRTLDGLSRNRGGVFTMGNLHDGHLSLIRAAKARNKSVAASIFVNPTQFSIDEDFNQYPRTMERDLELLEREGVDVCFTPSAEEIYPAAFSTTVDPGAQFSSISTKSEHLSKIGTEDCGGEGGARPHFFRGVATVCTRLLNIIRPSDAYFGQKDAMQCAVLKRIVDDLAIQTNIIEVPTVRAADGLALSSRNAYLSEPERQAAPILFASLIAGAQAYETLRLRFSSSNDNFSSDIRRTVVDAVYWHMKNPGSPSSPQNLATTWTIEYISLAAMNEDLREIPFSTESGSLFRRLRGPLVLSMAVRTGTDVRLIDNITLPCFQIGEPSMLESKCASLQLPPTSSNLFSPNSLTQHRENSPSWHQHHQRRDSFTMVKLAAAKRRQRPITMVTAYSTPMARHVDMAGIDMVLVGDSIGMVEHGLSSTTPVTVHDILRAACAVRRGVKRSMLIVDLPFGSYEASPAQALATAQKFIKEAGADAVKLEGGAHMAPTVEVLVKAGIPVVGHVGLSPQAIAVTGGFRAQGRTAVAATQIVRDACALESAGACAVVVECVPEVVGSVITDKLTTIPTIGIGAGNRTNGQVLVFHDLVGFSSMDFEISPADDNEMKTPKFCKQYASIGDDIQNGLRSFVQEVNDKSFPSTEYTPYTMRESEIEKFLKLEGIGRTEEDSSISTQLRKPQDQFLQNEGFDMGPSEIGKIY